MKEQLEPSTGKPDGSNIREQIMAHNTSQDITMAKRFLSHLSQDEEPIFAFQIFNDQKNSESSVKPQVLCGTFDEFVDQFIRLQEQGAGIFVTINQTDGKGRRTENIVRVRAVFIDLDGSPLGPILSAPLSPHLIIESSPSRYHAYWIIEGIDREHFSLIQKQLITRYQADPKVHDLPRVMRLPGFLHQKQDSFLTKIIKESGEQPFSAQQFLDAFGITISSQPIPPISSHKSTISNPVLEALEHRGMLIQKQSHPQGCWSIQCPWGQLHSQQDTGTKYYEPNTNGYSTHGFKCFHKHCELKTIYDLTTFLEVDIHCSMDPIPLYRQIEMPQPFPMDALGPILGPAAQAMHRVIKAPDSICAQSVLAAASLATQAHANITIDGRENPLSEFYLTIAESGDRKSATDKIALKAIFSWQKMLSDCYRTEYPKFQIQKEAWEARKKEWIKGASSDSTFSEPPPSHLPCGP